MLLLVLFIAFADTHELRYLNMYVPILEAVTTACMTRSAKQRQVSCDREFPVHVSEYTTE